MNWYVSFSAETGQGLLDSIPCPPQKNPLPHNGPNWKWHRYTIKGRWLIGGGYEKIGRWVDRLNNR